MQWFQALKQMTVKLTWIAKVTTPIMVQPRMELSKLSVVVRHEHPSTSTRSTYRKTSLAMARFYISGSFHCFSLRENVSIKRHILSRAKVATWGR